MKKSSSIFTSVPPQRVQRNHFDLSHEVKMSGKFGYLYPILVQECIPGDQMSDTATVFLRAAPLLSPVMHRINVKTNFFFVPNRIICDPWPEFITGGQTGSANVTLPYITPAALTAAAGDANEMIIGSLWDYLGLPIPQSPAITTSLEQISILQFRAYAKIWNDFFRDPNFDSEIDLGLEDQGPVTAASFAAGLFTIRSRGWRKDYFTAALPFAQRGTEVLMPLSGTGAVTYKDISTVHTAGGGQLPIGTYVDAQTGGSFSEVEKFKVRTDPGGAYTEAQLQNIDEVNITSSSVSINDLRLAIALQKWAEANARGGARYNEQIQSHFNTTVPDFRLQRAEYLGGGSQPIRISEVLATAESEFVDVGDMKGHGVSVGKSNGFSYRCQEHGFIIGILSVMPDTAYSQGLHPMWSRITKFDYAWPLLANLGEQEIRSKELFYSFDIVDDDDNQDVFGYIPRYSEYKFANDRLAGDFRETLAFWHLSRFFPQRPVLDEAFTTIAEAGTGFEESYRRIFAVQDGTDYFWMQIFHNLHAKRPLPFFGVPSL